MVCMWRKNENLICFQYVSFRVYDTSINVIVVLVIVSCQSGVAYRQSPSHPHHIHSIILSRSLHLHDILKLHNPLLLFRVLMTWLP